VVHRVSLTIQGRTHELTLAAGETVFAAALRAGIVPPFSCLGGYCGTCMGTLEEGEVDMQINKTLSPKQLARGLVLICQAVPSTAHCRISLEQVP
jgi:3-ketosteroid 9alpha-monooxygenase subunit B